VRAADVQDRVEGRRVAMSSLAGVNHITVLTGDLDRLAAFYEEVFAAPKLVELPVPEPDGPGRHALIGIGGGAMLHLFELGRVALPPARSMFDRGRIDHFALQVSDAATLARLRAELLTRGASDGTVTDFGIVRVLTFTDPDGHSVELAHWVGDPDGGELDMSRANDDQLIHRRATAASGGASSGHPFEPQRLDPRVPAGRRGGHEPCRPDGE